LHRPHLFCSLHGSERRQNHEFKIHPHKNRRRTYMANAPIRIDRR
jgi:hypothetical protein